MRNILKNDKNAQAELGDDPCVLVSVMSINANGREHVIMQAIHHGTFAECRALADKADGPMCIGPTRLIETSHFGILPEVDFNRKVKEIQSEARPFPVTVGGNSAMVN